MSFPRLLSSLFNLVLIGVLASSFAAAGAKAAGVVINEINYNTSNSANPAEFIELWNTDAAAANLSGWQFDAGITYAFPAGTTIPANGYLVISADPASFTTRWGFTPLGPWTGKLSNQGEQVRLRNASGVTADSVTYGAGFPWPTAADGDGSSLELINPNLDHNLGSSWRSSGQPIGYQPSQVYVPANAVDWHYRKGTSEASNPTSAWRNLSFAEDGTWLLGQTSIGYGDNDDDTILTDMQNHYSSIFMRRVFNVSAGQVPSTLKVSVRVDDGCIIWINGTEVARFHVDANLVPAYNSFAQDHEADPTKFESVTVSGASSFLVAGSNVVAVQTFNSSLSSSDLTSDVMLEAASITSTTAPTPGAVNSCYSTNAPPAIQQVANVPQQPVAGQAVVISAKVTDPKGLSSVMLKYQTVDPGAYVRLTDAAYGTSWTSVPMYDDGTHGDAAAGDSVYTATIPASVQTNRRLVRYRIDATNANNTTIEVPYPDDGSPNFAYFVYNGVPSWTGAFKAGATSTTFSSALQQSLPTYHLIASNSDVVNCQYSSSYNGQHFYGTLVYNGTVFDHVQFNNRGEASTYVSGKNKWRVHFNTARSLTPTDNWGHLYANPWKELTINACASPWCAVHRGMSGVEEALSLRFYELVGLSSPRSHFMQFRIIDDASETGTTQYQGGDGSGVNGGDLWGLYLAVENPDKSFIDDRSLADGNVYEIKAGVGDPRYQGGGQVTDGSDWSAFLTASKATQTESWWRANMDLPAYYSFAAGNRLIGNVDLRPGYNHCFYHNPNGLWSVIPWDLDMMFIPKTHQAGHIDQNNCLTLANLKIEYQNRARELIDLMSADGTASGGQIGQLIDEYAQMVAPTGVSPNWTQLDAAMWNTNTRTNASSSNAQTNHYGNFYAKTYLDSRNGGTWTRTLATADFAGSMAYLNGYATDTLPAGSTWAVNNGDQRGYGARYVASEAADTAVPQQPTTAYTGPAGYPLDKLQFTASTYAGISAYAATQWRIGEISAPGVPLYDATKPRIYEVTDVWRSAELTVNGAVTVPSVSVLVGHTYRLRVRQKDATGRWSRWSTATQFVAGAASAGLTSSQLVISEFMYHPPALSAAETAAGYTDREQFEYIELMNISTKTLDLSGLAFTNGVTYTFASGVTLAPGARILVVKNTAAFALRYGTASTVVGPYTGNLDNSGEEITLTSAGQVVQDFTYSDGTHPAAGQTVDPWPTAADGNGASLVLMNPTLAPDETLVTNWRASIRALGSPGQADLINYAEWSRRYPGLGNASADSDGDGWSNAAEYFFGTSPTVAGNHPVTSGILDPTVLSSGGTPYFVFTCTHSGESGDVNFFVEFSTDLQTWAQNGVLVGSVTNGDGTITERWRSAQPADGSVKSLFARQRAAFK